MSQPHLGMLSTQVQAACFVMCGHCQQAICLTGATLSAAQQQQQQLKGRQDVAVCIVSKDSSVMQQGAAAPAGAA